MPKFLEQKLKKEYGENSAVPYKVMNSQGLMRGSKETAKGAALQAKHDRDMAAEQSKPKGVRISPAAADRILEKADRLTKRR